MNDLIIFILSILILILLLFIIYKPIFLKLSCSGTLEIDESGKLNLKITKEIKKKYIIIEQKIITPQKNHPI